MLPHLQLPDEPSRRCVLSHFHAAVIRYPDESNIEGKGFMLAHSPRGTQSVMVGRDGGVQGGRSGRSRRLTGHLESTPRNRERRGGWVGL